MGYDRFYGFIGGETNNWYPDLAEDNHYVDQPYLPEDGYHLSKDLADKALEFIRDSKQTEPDKPWYLWFCPGANHAPHHAPEEYIAKYQGKFDDGYEAYREWVLPRMIERGILPEGTELTPINPMPPRAPSAQADAVRPVGRPCRTRRRRCSRRMAEVYAGFSEYTDAQVGRIVDYLEESGQLDNTIDPLLRRQRRLGRGSARTARSTRASSSTATPTTSSRTWRCSTSSAPRRPTTTTRPGGRWPSRRRTGCSSATPTRAGSATRW